MMLRWLVWIPVFPLLGFLVLALIGKRCSSRQVSWIGCGSVALSALVTLIVAASFVSSPPPGYRFSQSVFTFVNTGGLSADIGFVLDPLSLVMVVIVTVVGFFIHWYSVGYMENDDGFSRFFAYMNLFVGSMVLLLLADNLLLLFFGWEGVGLCSYLLIGFWYKNPDNVLAGQKAFIITRVGDTVMAVGLFLLFNTTKTLNIQEILSMAPHKWMIGAAPVVWASVLLLGGAVGKSAQLPLQTWLPDAMAGPTPVSALIHAATMVTAGVYLIARTHVLFELAPAVLMATAVIGGVTLLMAGISAMVQTDIKRTLAYSTISQIGYMFLALGVGAWASAIFHFFTHAFFKALLFLAAGLVIHSLDGEQDMRHMGGLFKKVPVAFITFLIGALALSAVPFLGSAFLSKDRILWDIFSTPSSNGWLWFIGEMGAFLTALYTFRMVFLVFFGPANSDIRHETGQAMKIPVVILACFTLICGLLGVPRFLEHGLPTVSRVAHSIFGETYVKGISALVVLLGIYWAIRLYYQNRKLPVAIPSKTQAWITRFFREGWGIDHVYQWVWVRPFRWVSGINKNDGIDRFVDGVSWVTVRVHRVLRLTQEGKVRIYAAAIVAGAIVIVALVVFL